MFRFEFISTIEDLLEAEEANRGSYFGRKPFRYLMVLLGTAWLIAGLVAFDVSRFSWHSILWLILGSLTVYFFAIRQYILQKKIRRNNAPQQDLTISFLDDEIIIHTEDGGEYKRSWDEFDGYKVSKNGILFCFSDGVVNWLPNRVFADYDEMKNLLAFVNTQGTGGRS